MLKTRLLDAVSEGRIRADGGGNPNTLLRSILAGEAMSLPRETKTELLSAYLDDALSGDERTRVEQILASDDEAKSLLEQMRSIQAATKAAMRSDQRPADGFSQRVVAVAMARAEQEQLPADHHVRVAASRAGNSGAGKTKTALPDRSRRQYGPVAVALTLAASLLLAGTLWNSFPGQGGAGGTANVPQDGNAIADSSKGSAEGLPDRVADPVDQPQDDSNATSSDIGSVAEADQVPVETPLEDRSTPELGERPAPEALATAEQGRQPMESDARTEPTSPAPEMDPALDDPAAMLATQAVMMFEVEQTEMGRANNVVLQEMRKAGIQADLTQRVNDAIVGYLQEADLVGEPGETSDGADASSQVSVVYVEASGKQLDQFMVSLFGDTEQIARIGWSMAMDAPVLQAARQIEQILPTEVRHADDASTAWQLVTGDIQQGFTAPGAGREFFPIDRTDPEGWSAMGSADSGSDIRSRLLILIR